MTGLQTEILYVEDNPADVRLVLAALERCGVHHRLHVAADGVEAVAFLRRQAPFVDAPRPHLVLLDLNLPRKDGREVLGEIKADVDLRRIPVLVFTTSTAEEDVLSSYDLHANAYLTKPIRLKDLVELLANLDRFWFSQVTLPQR